ncbi:MAG: hypothetical protein WAT19_13585 [Ferruginibacter sp.]
MDKLNIKELLALAITGASAIFCYIFILSNGNNTALPSFISSIFQKEKFATGNAALDALVALLVLLVIGAFTDYLTRRIIKNRNTFLYKCYAFFSCDIYPASRQVINELWPAGNKLRSKIDGYAAEDFGETFLENPSERADKISSDIFDKAFYSISKKEDHGRDTVLFRQGFYMMLRNIFLVLLLAVFFSLTLIPIGLLPFKKAGIIVLFFLLINYVIIIPLAKWYRRMLVEALFNHYIQYREQINKP